MQTKCSTQELDDFYDSNLPPLDGDPAYPPAAQKTGFTGKTQAQLWQYLLENKWQVSSAATQLGTLYEQLGALQAGRPDDRESLNAKRQEIAAQTTNLKKTLIKEGVGHKVVDNLMRVETARLEAMQPTITP